MSPLRWVSIRRRLGTGWNSWWTLTCWAPRRRTGIATTGWCGVACGPADDGLSLAPVARFVSRPSPVARPFPVSARSNGNRVRDRRCAVSTNGPGHPNSAGSSSHRAFRDEARCGSDTVRHRWPVFTAPAGRRSTTPRGGPVDAGARRSGRVPGSSMFGVPRGRCRSERWVCPETRALSWTAPGRPGPAAGSRLGQPWPVIRVAVGERCAGSDRHTAPRRRHHATHHTCSETSTAWVSGTRASKVCGRSPG